MSELVFWLAIAFCGILGACLAIPLLWHLWRAMGETVRRFCKCGVIFCAFALALTFKGATKNILPRFSSDAGITVTAAEINVATNDTDTTTLFYSYAGTNDVALPLWVRQSVSNEWAHLDSAWLYDDRFYANGTNTVFYFVNPPASNIVPYVMYYVGDNPPPVEIEESGGVEIVSFVMSSKAAVITYAVDGAMLRGGTGLVRVERNEADNVWAEVYATNHAATATNTVTATGFWIDRRTRWRVRMEVGQ